MVANICINGFHDGSISIVDENGVVAHLLEERYVHVKHQGPPMVCLSKIEDYIDTFDDLSFTHLFHQFADFNWAIAYLHYISKVTTPDKLMTPMIHSGHHDLHAICGFSHSGFDDAVVVVIDGAGSTFEYGKENQTIYEIYDSSIQILERNLVGDGTPIDVQDCPDYVNKKTNIEKIIHDYKELVNGENKNQIPGFSITGPGNYEVYDEIVAYIKRDFNNVSFVMNIAWDSYNTFLSNYDIYNYHTYVVQVRLNESDSFRFIEVLYNPFKKEAISDFIWNKENSFFERKQN